MSCKLGEDTLEIKWKDYDNSYTWKGMREKIMEAQYSFFEYYESVPWVYTENFEMHLNYTLHWNTNWIGRNKQHQHKYNFKWYMSLLTTSQKAIQYSASLDTAYMESCAVGNSKGCLISLLKSFFRKTID